ncbi:sugar phosphate nucleotidyltransferase [Thermoclostridium stercorarium]|nr:sugar phosphate nucleotidyltransferase [Thermoclostridium stercorarium]UZQ84549.1 sugar phosphate nucleotidyltransferase [Thermoclostridium stercorarium]
MEKFAILMAGGSGTRLWPLSKEASPKQFIPVEGENPMLVQTVIRLSGVVEPERCFIITNLRLTDITKNTVRKYIPEENILTEPERKILPHALRMQHWCLRKDTEKEYCALYPPTDT